MAKFTASTAELQRAQAMAQRTQEVLVDGVDGAELLDPVVTLENFEGIDGGALVKAMLRRTAYGIFRALTQKPAPHVITPAQFSNNWTHQGGSFNTRLLCWVDAEGYKHIAGGVYRSSGSAVNGETICTLPAEFAPAEDAKVFLVATNTGVGRVDLFGRTLLYRTTGGYTTGWGYVFFDSVPGWR